MVESKKRLSEASKGENHPMYGKKHTEEARKKIGEAKKERFKDKENHPFYGKKHSEEAKKQNQEYNEFIERFVDRNLHKKNPDFLKYIEQWLKYWES